MLKEVLHTYKSLEDCSPHLRLLHICIPNNSLSRVKNVHSFIAHRRFASTILTTFHNKLIHMYVKCGSLVDARKVFDNLKERDCVSWNTIIAAYREHGCPQKAVTLFHHMQQAGLQPDQVTFASILKACTKMGALEQGMHIHKRITEGGFLSDIIVGNALVDMYAKCGIIDKARELFDSMPQRDVISWTAMIIDKCIREIRLMGQSI